MKGDEVPVQTQVGALRVVVDPGRTATLGELPPYAIALDGYVQAPQLDLAGHRLSFDHHDGCLRLVTSATCRQVLDALLLGLDPAPYTVFVNDLDGDTVLSVALLAHPGWLRGERAAAVRRLVGVVAERDAHGPAYPVAEPELLARFGVEVVAGLPDARSAPGAERMAAALVGAVDRIEGVLGPDSPADRSGRDERIREERFWEVTHRGTGWVMVRSDAAVFDLVYGVGHDRAVLWQPLAGRQHGVHPRTAQRSGGRLPGRPGVGAGVAAGRPGPPRAGLGRCELGGRRAPAPDGSRSRLAPDEVFGIVEDAVLADLHGRPGAV